MTSYVALLRGINVGGNRKLLMADLRNLVSELGYSDVSTYLQSGNALFTSALPAAQVSAALSRALPDVDVLLRTKQQLGALLAGNPYLGQEDDFTKLHVTFLATEPAADKTEVPIPAGETGVLTLAGTEVFLHCPAGYGRTKLNNAYLERRLGVRATTRNWKSVLALHDLLKE